MQENLKADLVSAFIQICEKNGVEARVESDHVVAGDVSVQFDLKPAFNMVSHKYDMFYPISEIHVGEDKYTYIGQERKMAEPDFKSFIDKFVLDTISRMRDPNPTLVALKQVSMVGTTPLKPFTPNNSKENK